MVQTTADVWSWYQTDTDEDIFPIASEPDFGVDIYALRTPICLSIVVEADGEICYEEEVFSVDECARAINTLCDTYLTFAAFDELAGAYDEEESRQELIDDREAELDGAFSDLLSVVLDSLTPREIDEIADDVKEHLLRYIYEHHGFPIYRPMVLEDENGEEFYEEYPYEFLEFDEEE